MADFEQVFKKIIFNEGGYVNDPDDAGGETYMGISRRSYPKNEIWNIITPIVKTYKKNATITKVLKQNAQLTNMIRNIYKRDYWDKFDLDFIQNTKLAYQIFDSAVNIGVAGTKKLLSRVDGTYTNK